MDLSHARTLLQRINRVFDGFGEGDAAPSTLERDLLKEYVRRFYEALDADPTAANYRNGGRPKQQTKAEQTARERAEEKPDRTRRPLSGRPLRQAPVPGAPPAAPPPAAPSPAAPSPAVPVPMAKSTSRPATPAPTPSPASTPPPSPAPAMIHVPESVEADVRKIEAQSPTPTPASTSSLDTSRAAAPSAVTPAPVSPASSPSTSATRLPELEPELRELFARERGTDLGDRLGNAPVSDLTRALALNQRLVFQNQLFGKDAAALRDTLTELNNQDGYEDAVLALVGTAREHDWTDEERRGPARDFVKLVQRRYPAS